MNASNLRPTNKIPNGKKEDLIRMSSKKSITLMDNQPGMILINTSQ